MFLTDSLRQLYFLRSKIKGHAAEAQRQQLIMEARTENGSLREHFKQIAFDCQEVFEKACSSLSRHDRSPMPGQRELKTA
jgi:hypothetical protein